MEPLAVWDVRETGWWPGREVKSEWARRHGVPVDVTYRLEFYLADAPFARVFSYHLNEEGRRHLGPQHNPHRDHDHSACKPATVPPFDLPLTELPPRELCGAR